MTKRISAREVHSKFEELAADVHRTGEPVIVEERGEPVVLLVSVKDFESLERSRREDEALRKFTEQLRADPAYLRHPEPEDADIALAVKRTRQELYRERYKGRPRS